MPKKRSLPPQTRGAKCSCLPDTPTSPAKCKRWRMTFLMNMVNSPASCNQRCNEPQTRGVGRQVPGEDAQQSKGFFESSLSQDISPSGLQWPRRACTKAEGISTKKGNIWNISEGTGGLRGFGSGTGGGQQQQVASKLLLAHARDRLLLSLNRCGQFLRWWSIEYVSPSGIITTK